MDYPWFQGRNQGWGRLQIRNIEGERRRKKSGKVPQGEIEEKWAGLDLAETGNSQLRHGCATRLRHCSLPLGVNLC